MEYQEIADEEDLKEQRASSYALAGIRKEMDAFQALQGLKKGDTKTTEAEQKELSHLNGVVRLVELSEPSCCNPLTISVGIPTRRAAAHRSAP